MKKVFNSFNDRNYIIGNKTQKISLLGSTFNYYFRQLFGLKFVNICI